MSAQSETEAQVLSGLVIKAVAEQPRDLERINELVCRDFSKNDLYAFCGLDVNQEFYRPMDTI